MGFQPGNKGRIKEKHCYDALMLEMRAAEDLRGVRVIARKLLDLAAQGDLQAIKEVFNRIDGMPVQQIDQNIETTTYVAELPSVTATTSEWLNKTLPNPQLQ